MNFLGKWSCTTPLGQIVGERCLVITTPESLYILTKTLVNCKKFIYPRLPTKEARKSIYGDIRELISKHDDVGSENVI